jgi:hypothetical protein
MLPKELLDPQGFVPVNVRNQVIHNGEPVPGLYASGDITSLKPQRISLAEGRLEAALDLLALNPDAAIIDTV